jgi:thymidylate synthase (methanogen type)
MTSIFFVEATDVASTWVELLRRVLIEGDDITTQYDTPGDPPAKDSTAMINIKEPFSNPMINFPKNDDVRIVKSKYNNKWKIYGHRADPTLVPTILDGYIEEVLDGIRDDGLWNSDRSYPYSYHDRLFNYAPFSLEDVAHKDYPISPVKKEEVQRHEKLMYKMKVIDDGEKKTWKLDNDTEIALDHEINEQLGFENVMLSTLSLPRINQIDQVIVQLRENPNTRRAQAITWRPYIDPYIEEPPCLQRLYFRIKQEKLILESSWRSRDLFKAWDGNVNGIMRIQEKVANALEIETGELIEFNNSLHVYGKDIKKAREILEQINQEKSYFC